MTYSAFEKFSCIGSLTEFFPEIGVNALRVNRAYSDTQAYTFVSKEVYEYKNKTDSHYVLCEAE